MKQIEKVLAYVTRGEGASLEILVFDHVGLPEAGVQVPSGSVEVGESLEVAARREALEETGLSITSDAEELGQAKHLREDRSEIHYRHIFRFHLPSASSNEWIHTVSGDGEDHEMKFRCYWMSITEARKVLAVGQDDYLAMLMIANFVF